MLSFSMVNNGTHPLLAVHQKGAVNEDLFDVFIRGSNMEHPLPSHRFILGAISPVLSTALRDLPVFPEICIIVPDSSQTSVINLLRFIKSEELQLSAFDYLELLELMQLIDIDHTQTRHEKPQNSTDPLELELVPLQSRTNFVNPFEITLVKSLQSRTPVESIIYKPRNNSGIESLESFPVSSHLHPPVLQNNNIIEPLETVPVKSRLHNPTAEEYPPFDAGELDDFASEHEQISNNFTSPDEPDNDDFTTQEEQCSSNFASQDELDTDDFTTQEEQCSNDREAQREFTSLDSKSQSNIYVLESERLSEEPSSPPRSDTFLQSNKTRTSTRSKKPYPKSAPGRKTSLHLNKTPTSTRSKKPYPESTTIVHQPQLLSSSPNSFACPSCEWCFASDDYLQRHVKLKHGGGAFRCAQCPFASRHKVSLASHVRRVHEQRRDSFPCDVCEKSFSLASLLRRHKQHVHDKRSFTLRCEFCPQTFPSQSYLIRHTRSHTGEKPFVCDICGQGTAISGNLKKHKLLCHKIV